MIKNILYSIVVIVVCALIIFGLKAIEISSRMYLNSNKCQELSKLYNKPTKLIGNECYINISKYDYKDVWVESNKFEYKILADYFLTH